MISIGDRELARPVLLIVDDDAAVLHSLKFSLELEGFEVRIYGDAATLLNAADLPKTGCLLIDYTMPGMNGLELVGELRRRNVALPAILITGHPSQTLRKRALDAGIPFIEKPLLDSGLRDTIRAAIGSDSGLRR